jgi:hypothetical protein
MPSQKQLEANRLNAAKPTGPRSSMNPLKTGIDAKSQIIRGEKVANLEALATDYYTRFHPTTPEQRMLVDTLIDAEWLLRRFRKVEAQLWEKESLEVLRPKEDVILAQAYWNSTDRFARLQRRIDTAHKNYRIALQDLQRLQAEEAALDVDPDPDPAPEPTHATPRNQSINPPNGFVPPAILESPTPDPPSRLVSPETDVPTP